MASPVPSAACLRALRSLVFQTRGQTTRTLRRSVTRHCRRLQHAQATSTQHNTPIRAQIKQDAKAQRPAKKQEKTVDPRLEKWDLTVGIEVHAELSTASKLFSPANTPVAALPNTHSTIFDTAEPGAQPKLQKTVLLPALRAALALDCDIQEKSGWDRKHYFWWDQPQGYQITQYYQPFARNGQLLLQPWDDIDPADADTPDGTLSFGIKQVQMEQDTAKTVLQPPDTFLLDFNRAGLPLVEIITKPEIKSPKTAAAVVKKIQALLQSVGANSTGMEMGGLRADVNVSVRRRDQQGSLEYDGVTGLGQRTEIKNLSSFKAVEDAIVAERDRQIDVLESGGVIEGETRGWTLGASTTRRLRGKEGEVDYRYMPDPDLPPLRISPDLVSEIQAAMPLTPAEGVKQLTSSEAGAMLHSLNSVNEPQGLSLKDAKTLMSLDDGERLEFYLSVLHHVRSDLDHGEEHWHSAPKVVANWILMDLPTFLNAKDLSFPYYYTFDDSSEPMLGSLTLASIIVSLLRGAITQQSARALLAECRHPNDLEGRLATHIEQADASREDFLHAKSLIDEIIEENGLRFIPLSADGYTDLAARILETNADMANKASEEFNETLGKKRGKLMWLVGQMIRNGEDGKVDAKQAERFAMAALAQHHGLQSSVATSG